GLLFSLISVISRRLAQARRRLAEMSETNRRLLNTGLVAIWVTIFSLGIVIPLFLTPNHQRESATVLGNLAMFGPKKESKEKESKEKFAEWERKEAIKFSLDQIDSSIKYLFIGAATLLGFILKVLIEPHISKKEQSATATMS